MDFIFDPSLVLYLPLYELDGASFMSKDAYGHLCTVTGALWTPQGRDFDGLDDIINCGTNASLSSLNYPFTVMAWVNPNTLGAFNVIFTRVVHTGWWLQIHNTYLRFQSSPSYVDSTGFTVLADVWQHVAAVANGSTVTFYYQGTAYNSPAFTESLGEIGGASLISQTSYDFYGLIGEVMMYSRALIPAEVQHNYLATKWRYQK